MSRALHLQSVAFVVLAGSAIGLSLAGVLLPQTLDLRFLALMILLLGVPHGAMDTILAERMFAVSGFRKWLLFLVQYLILAGTVVVVSIGTPTLFLAAFVLISCVHFSMDLRGGTSTITRILYAGGIVVIPATWHADHMQQIFTQLSGPEAASVLMVPLRALGYPCLVGLCGAALYEGRAHRLAGLEVLAVALLMWLTDPLLSFTLFFCFMHSLRHMVRAVALHPNPTIWYYAKMVGLPMLAICVSLPLVWGMVRHLPMDDKIIQIVFVGLAALTLPHMVIVERLRGTFVRKPSVVTQDLSHAG